MQTFFDMHIFLIATLLCLTHTSPAHPLQPRNQLTAASILKITPSTSTCASPPAPGECRTATQAAPYLAISFTNFGLTSFPIQAALLSLILYETADFKYSKNHFPGVPGQGTRNMQSPQYNLEYAKWLATVCTNCGITTQQVDAAQAQGPAAVLELVNGDEWGFGSAAWFFSTQCSADVKKGLAAGTESGWDAYLTTCIGTSVTEERTAVWRKAMALGHW